MEPDHWFDPELRPHVLLGSVGSSSIWRHPKSPKHDIWTAYKMDRPSIYGVFLQSMTSSFPRIGFGSTVTLTTIKKLLNMNEVHETFD